MKKSKKNYGTGGLTQWDLPSSPDTPGYRDYGSMYTVPGWKGLMYKPVDRNKGWEGYGNPDNLLKSTWSGTQESAPLHQQPTKQLAMNAGDYSIDNIRSQYMKNGGSPKKMYWDGTKFVKSKNSTWSDGNSYKKGGVIMKDGKPCYECGDMYEQDGKFNYKPFERKDGYYDFYSYIEDGGNMAELRDGGYVPASINAKPHILERTDGVYHMRHGGQAPINYIPALGNAVPKILPRTDGVAHLQFGGVHQPTPMAETGGYYRTYPWAYDGGHIAEARQGGAYIGLNFDPVQFADGGIHIKPENRGKFTAWAKSHGMGVQEAASHVLANKEDYSSTIVKRANFAHNAAGWKKEDGGHVFPEDTMRDDDNEMKKGGNWIKGAVNPAHKGYCTPMTKSTCTPRRKAFAMTMKKHHGFHKEEGGLVNPFHPLAYANGGPYDEDGGVSLPSANNAWGSSAANTEQTMQEVYRPAEEANQLALQVDENSYQNRPMVTSPRANMNEIPVDASGFNNPYAVDNAPQQMTPSGPTGWQKAAMYGQGFNNLLGAGLMTASHFANRKNERNMAAYNRSLGMSSNIPAFSNPGGHGDYNSQGMFRPDKAVKTNPGYYAPQRAQMGGMMSRDTIYKMGGEYDVDEKEIQRLKKLGYKVQYV